MSLRVTLNKDEACWRAKLIQPGFKQSINLKFDRGSSQFTGITTIHLDCLEPCVGLWLEYVGKSVDQLLLNGVPQKVDWDGKRLQLPSIEIGAKIIEVHFTAEVTNRGVGIHHYHDPKNQTDYYYSNLCPYDAGRIFPCFDQPDLKARFALSVDLPSDWVVVANYPLENETISGEIKHVKFAETPPLATYVFALCFGDYKKIEGPSGDLPMNIYCRSEKIGDVDSDYIFKIIDEARIFYEEFFRTDFGFAKYDQVFVPEFNWGAMENVGCVVLREEMLFSSPPSNRELFGRDNTLVHELAHMWFGNLVTMDWWDDLWLNEAFATLMAYICLERIGYHKDSSLYFHYEVQVEAKEQDSFRSTHPVVVDCRNTDEAFQNFDAITYLKGASVLKQLLYFIGEEEFSLGLEAFFREFKFANANLHRFLEYFGDANLFEWSTQWLNSVGFNKLLCSQSTDSLEIMQTSDKGPDYRKRSFLLQAWSLRNGGKILWEQKIRMEQAKLIVNVPSISPDLWILNGNDHDFVKMGLDSNSFNNLSNYIFSLESEALKLQLCTSLFEMVEEGRLALKSFYEMFSPILLSNSKGFVRRVCLDRLSPYLNCKEMYSVKLSIISNLHEQFFDSEGESRIYNFRKLLALSRTENERLALRSYLDIELNEDQRLDLLANLAAMDNQVGDNALKELQKYQSYKARRIYAKALVTNSRDGQREEYFKSFFNDQESSLGELSARMSGFFISGLDLDLENYACEYYRMLKNIESERDQNFLKRYFIDLHPSGFISIGLFQISALLKDEQSAVMYRQLIHWQDYFIKKKKIYDSNKFMIDS